MSFEPSRDCIGLGVLNARLENHYTVKRVLSGHSKIGSKDRLSFDAGQKYCRMLSWSILHYF